MHCRLSRRTTVSHSKPTSKLDVVIIRAHHVTLDVKTTYVRISTHTACWRAWACSTSVNGTDVYRQCFQLVSDSPDFGLLGEKSFPKWEIPCTERPWTNAQNLTLLALSSPEKSVTVQTIKDEKQTVYDISITCLSACVDNNVDEIA